MATVPLQAIVEFCKDEPKLVQRGENAVESNHVVQFSYDSQNAVIHGKVQASMKQKAYDVNITMTDKKTIAHTSCTCPRGQFKCHHITALLIYCNRNVSRTDVSCQWKRSKGSLKDRTTASMTSIYSHPKPSYLATKGRQFDKEEKQWLQQELRTLPTMNLHWLLAPSLSASSARTVVPTVDTVLSTNEYRAAVDKINYLRPRLAVSAEVTVQVEQQTRGQHNSSLWLSLRAGRLTASKFGPVVRACRKQSFPPSLLKSLLGVYNLRGVKAVQWGIDHEDEAIDEYRKQFNSELTAVGLVLHSSGVLGASPDRLEGTDGLVEVKCPYSLRHLSIPEALQQPSMFIHMNNDGEYCLKHDHDYYHQCQGQLCLTGRQYLYLYVWLPKGSLRVLVPKDKNWEAVSMSLLINFWFEHLLPAYEASLCHNPQSQ